MAAPAPREFRRGKECHAREREDRGGDNGKRKELAPRNRERRDWTHLRQLKPLRLAFRRYRARGGGENGDDEQREDSAKPVEDEHLPLALVGRVGHEDEIGGEHPPERRHEEHQRGPRPYERDGLKPENPPKRNHRRCPPLPRRTPRATRRVPIPFPPRRICRGSRSLRDRRYPPCPQGDAKS